MQRSEVISKLLALSTRLEADGDLIGALTCSEAVAWLMLLPAFSREAETA